MPQLIAEDWAPQLIWLVITFVGLYLIMARVALPRIGGVIEQRRDRIAHDLDQAARFKEQTEQAIAAYESDLAEARAKAHELAQEARDKLAAESDEKHKALEAQLDAKLAEAEAQIAETRRKAMAEVKGVASETAVAIVEQLIGAKVTKKKASEAVAQASDA